MPEPTLDKLAGAVEGVDEESDVGERPSALSCTSPSPVTLGSSDTAVELAVHVRPPSSDRAEPKLPTEPSRARRFRSEKRSSSPKRPVDSVGISMSKPINWSSVLNNSADGGGLLEAKSTSAVESRSSSASKSMEPSRGRDSTVDTLTPLERSK